MLLPVKHENMTTRRWPVITLGLILLNLLIFLATHRAMEKQEDSLWSVKMHVLVLAAQHPDLAISPKAQQFVADFQVYDPADWAEMQSSSFKPIDDWDAQMRNVDDREQLQTEMDSIAAEYDKLTASSIAERFAFIPAHPRPIAYLSSTFLHGGWLHLIGNMWFLWLAGFVLEDAWGRPLYLAFYLTAGIAATQFDAWANPGSIAVSYGASGAVAGLMGAFLVRFPKLKIRLVWFFGSWLSGFWGLWVRAYWLLPLWLGMEIYYGKLSGQGDGIAHWAHVGGFAFGALAALVLRYSGLEHRANKAIEKKVSWTADPEINEASELVENGKLDQATVILNQYLAGKPGSHGAWSLLRIVHWRNNDLPGCREATCKVCELNLRAGVYEAAWQDYEEFLNLGGGNIAPATWLELCRVAEEQKDYRRALSEYQKLVAAYPSERQGLMAQVGAARISLKRLNRPDEALRLYRAASASAIPHLDLEQDIESGIQEAEGAVAQQASMVT
ncbi:MAG: rhomboid family intramembrane serine protease [Candidatus Acidiferrum sp.]